MIQLAVAVVLARGDGRTLVVRRAPGRPAAGYWTPITGKVEAGETLSEAGAREALEEMGLVVTIGKELYRCPTVGAPFELVWFDATLQSEAQADATRLSAEIAEARWLPVSEAAELQPMFAVTAAFYRGRVTETW